MFGRLFRSRLTVLLALPAMIATMALVTAAATADDVAPPPAPAFYTQKDSRISDIKGDSFAFKADDGKAMRVRLIDADVEPLGDAARSQAQAVAEKLIGDGPVWVFPVGRSQNAAEVWGDVWTPKGWLSQVLIKAGYAQHRAEPAVASLAAFDGAGTSNKGPAPEAPAFLATSAKAVTGDTFEIENGARKLKMRLFDAACEAGGSGTETATRLLAKGPVWVFPCGQQPLDAKLDWPARVWTAEGWLSDALIKAGQAKRQDAPEKQVAAAKPEAAAPKAVPAKHEHPAETTIEWKQIPVTLTKSAGASSAVQNAMSYANKGGGGGGYGNYAASGNSAESDVFKVSSGMWRVQWEAKLPEGRTARVTVQVLHCGVNKPDATAKTPSTQVFSSGDAVGGTVLRTMPGNYWIKVIGSTEVNAKVEEAVQKTAEKAAEK
jgi:endonuclease YncB( thermonuclease family)